jgi:putative ABC transport system permease protein
MSMGVRQGSGASNTLTVEDAAAIRQTIPGAQYVAPGVNTRNQVIAGNQNWQTRIEGTDVEFPMIRRGRCAARSSPAGRDQRGQGRGDGLGRRL